MKFVEDVTLDLARRTLELVEKTDDDTIVDKVADALGAPVSPPGARERQS